ncbi:MAG: phosphoribosylglycinamide formyltransferase [Spirochaetia bacterium]|nr:phosphoribosylglycinamide formyltransferase [Spirochaetia bacterium]
MNSSSNRPKIAILISGRGSNMQVILERVKDGSLPLDVVLVFSDKMQAQGLQIAKAAGIETETFSPSEFASFSDYEEKLVNVLKQAQAEWIICAGYMRIIKKNILTNFQGKILNIHPSLLPSFRGLNAQKQALDAGVKVAGCTVHFVNEEVDSGAIIAQAVVEVLEQDTLTDLTNRILKAEHETYWKAIKKVTLKD